MTFKFPAPIPPQSSMRAAVAVILSEDFADAKAFNLWEAHLLWLSQDLGWTRALEQAEDLKPEDFGPPSGHEVVDLLNDFIFQTGYVNAHTGLTSSDIVDNVRLIQLQELVATTCLSLYRLRKHVWNHADSERETVGFTHWQPAAPLTWRHRVAAWMFPINQALSSAPVLYAKQFGGPVGDQASLKHLAAHLKVELGSHPFPWDTFALQRPRNLHGLQSSDHTGEMEVIQWVARIAAALHKIALDLRFLASQGLVFIERPLGHAGSSSMPHKTNPYKWEKVCSITRSISTTQEEMWAVMANNSLERTLDTSWQLKALIARAFHGLGLALDEMCNCRFGIDAANEDRLRQLRPLLSSDRDLLNAVLGGQSRFHAFKASLHAHHHNDSPDSNEKPAS